MAGSGVTVVFFVVTQRPTRSLNPLALNSRGVLRELREVCESITSEVGEGLFRRAAAGSRVKLDDLVSEYWKLRLRRTQQAMRTDCAPLLCTHVLEDEANDQVYNHMKSLWIGNGPTTRSRWCTIRSS